MCMAAFSDYGANRLSINLLSYYAGQISEFRVQARGGFMPLNCNSLPTNMDIIALPLSLHGREALWLSHGSVDMISG